MADQSSSTAIRTGPAADQDLLGRYAESGDAEAFQQLVERYQNLVWSACMRVLKNPSEAEDAVQNVFLALAKNASSVESNLAAWLHTSAVNQSTSLIRSAVARRKREQRRGESLVTVEEQHVWKEIRELIDVCISELRADDRELVIERFYLGRTQAEIGERFGIGQQAVSVRIKKIIQHLRHALRQRGLSVSSGVLAAALGAGLAEAAVPAHIATALAKVGISRFGFSSPAMSRLTIGIGGPVALLAAFGLVVAWFFWGRNNVEIDDVLAELGTARSIQYSKTRLDAAAPNGEPTDPPNELLTVAQRYYVLDGYLERVDDLNVNGDVVTTTIANYRTGDVLRINPRARTYSTNVKLKRQTKELLSSTDETGGPELAPHTDLADYLEQFTPDAVEVLAARSENGRELIGLQTNTRGGMQGMSAWKHTIWIDRDTMRPVSTLVAFRNDHPNVGASDWVRDRFVFDVELPQSLFSMAPPAGYKNRNPARNKMSGTPLP